jgi:hypothetical protein
LEHIQRATFSHHQRHLLIDRRVSIGFQPNVSENMRIIYRGAAPGNLCRLRLRDLTGPGDGEIVVTNAHKPERSRVDWLSCFRVVRRSYAVLQRMEMANAGRYRRSGHAGTQDNQQKKVIDAQGNFLSPDWKTGPQREAKRHSDVLTAAVSGCSAAAGQSYHRRSRYNLPAHLSRRIDQGSSIKDIPDCPKR